MPRWAALALESYEIARQTQWQSRVVSRTCVGTSPKFSWQRAIVLGSESGSWGMELAASRSLSRGSRMLFEVRVSGALLLGDCSWGQGCITNETDVVWFEPVESEESLVDAVLDEIDLGGKEFVARG